jgi:cellulose synthase/poly-beta-1,6-N-acetylglucosamine synthase-like glycosyltransferase
VPVALRQEYELQIPTEEVGQNKRTSVSRLMYERFERRKTWRRFVSLSYIFILTCYLGWRITIINPDSLFLSLTYYVADLFGFFLNLTAIVVTWRYSHRDPPPAPSNLTVDIFLPTYKEPINIIRRTVMAAKAIDYPHGMFLLDDGKREDVRALAAEMGVRYLRRPDNKHAKAGNLNYGLAHSKADFVAVFDADHIALPHALDVTLGFFAEKNVAMVQTPQDYYNLDAFQYIPCKRTGAIWHDQSNFYNMVQTSGDSINAVTGVGTGVIYRRSALDRIGGVPVDTVTEDIHTSLKLHKLGYQVVYLNEPVAYGIAAADLDEYTKTRLRWGHGNIHALTLEKVLFCKTMSWRQRYQYLAMQIIYLEGWQHLLLMSIPIIALTFGLQPFKITIFNVLVVLLFPFFNYVMMQEIGCGFMRYWTTEIFSMARWPIYLQVWAGALKRKIPFRSSAKNMQGLVNWRLMAPQMFILGASLFALGVGIYRLHGNFEFGPLFQFIGAKLTRKTGVAASIDINTILPKGYTIDFVAISGFWALYSVVRATFFTIKTYHDAANSNEFYRFSVPIPVTFASKILRWGRICKVSETWAQIICYGEGPLPAPGQIIDFTAFMPAGPLPLRLLVESTDGRKIEGALIWASERLRDQLANGLYSVDWHREFLHRTAYFATPSDIVLSYLLLQSPLERKYGLWQALLYSLDGSGQSGNFGVMGNILAEKGYASLITFQNLRPGDKSSGMIFSDSGTSPLRFEIVDEEPLSSLVRKGLDGAYVRRYRVKLAKP